jgi:acyl-coenzyme A thioesterase PaaI-like protein|tara:strand:+ start:652 stop:1077 length:426 start_codon:yes stop_codon:yes gene_type:complete
MKDLSKTQALFLDNKPEFLDILGFTKSSFNSETSVYSCTFEPSETLTHSNGTIVQGGFIAGMLDAAMAQYVLHLYEFKVTPLTLNIDVTYLLPCRPAEVQVTSKILKAGKSIVFTSAELFQGGNLIATASATNKLVLHAQK